MEKMFSGMESSGRSDGGVTSRVTSDLLYWLQEKTEPVYVVGTINNIDMGLSGAHIRAGRWDGMFWFDAPSPEDREDIFNIHISKVGRKPNKFDIKELVKASNQYTGAEIETAIGTAMKRTFKLGKEFDTKDILWGLTQVNPITKTKEKEIEGLRKWAKESGAKSASGVAKAKTVETWMTEEPRKIH
jgi:SpoVK/Ycf46/Vps4 family AAA+-type ATPase